MNEWIRSSKCDSVCCVEFSFRKSSHSSGNGNCVEVGMDCDCGVVLVRDSKDPDGPVLTFPKETFLNFLAGVKNKEFELPGA